MSGGPDPAALNRVVRLRIWRALGAAALWAVAVAAAADGGWAGYWNDGVVLLVVFAAIYCPWALVFAVTWTRRLRAARRSGWRPAKTFELGNSDGNETLLLTSRHERMIVMTVSGLRGRYEYLGKPQTMGWIAGAGRQMTLVTDHGPRAAGLYAVPIRQIGGKGWTAIPSTRKRAR
ncbi:hypothetical protein ABZU76_01055 [Amycolatopsis sp. NPDC005232]|uniref:hypothetical protein n=1 Tax=Amycolatopsis sp. NPDC005232 TaxID=3157027 RepID=UPI0033A823D5